MADMLKLPDFDSLNKLIELKRKDPEEYKKIMEDLMGILLDFAMMTVKMEKKLELMEAELR